MDMNQQKDKAAFESAIRALESEVANIGAHLTVDSTARQMYSKQIRAMSTELRIMASTGKITWAQAASQANEARNVIMELVRTRSTPIGLAIAQKMKQQGRTLNELIAKKAQALFGRGVSFNDLAVEQQNRVYSEIVKSAGKSDPKVTTAMKKLSHAGRGFLFLSMAFSVYTVATAENKFDAAGKEVAITGAGIGGGIAGGALAGLACGPGAPVCVTVGAFVGGALAAFGVGLIW
ncbi:hypothetical protein MSP8887_00253 [Marinomonas spartinae]|uniref:Uncharacterized protein n=1 Tax=Marinomonas spartinae TaxID=1792290 RepID=A0A1A8TJ93_9GAMM|nr:hypothetical protein [Marinomonas spartinae]SBS25745.1 hypothetical protein MSP8887_00253 [Marinomonas spartinae]SBS32301.1 hypothetical protein MSP8886_02383 [Marinomonas spartinae]